MSAALAAWERRQLALGHDLLARCRAIGDSSQLSGTFRPGDPRLIFGLYGPGTELHGGAAWRAATDGCGRAAHAP